MAEDEKEHNRKSKLSSLLNEGNENSNNFQITVYYSENNWETCEEINLMVDENTTVNQLMDSAIYQFKTELFFENIDKKQFNLKLFKKKAKKPNDEYPICNSESIIKNYGKTHFCLVEIMNNKKPENMQEMNNKSKHVNNNNDININEEEINTGINNEKQDKHEKGYKTCVDKCFSCGIL